MPFGPPRAGPEWQIAQSTPPLRNSRLAPSAASLRLSRRAGCSLASERIDAWLELAARAMDEPGDDLWEVALHGRVAIAAAARAILEEAARACGSHPFATGGVLDRVRRDLELFLLQHRLDSGLARAGAVALDLSART